MDRKPLQLRLEKQEAASGSGELNERQRLVLKEVCDAFISTGVPVGSRTISRFSSLSCSPATIRNEMADLEEMGFLYSPHTSAGRVPTEKGYRFYVRFLVEYERISQLEEAIMARMAKIIDERNAKVENVLRSTLRLACDNTRLGGIILTPQKPNLALRSVQLYRILEDRGMLVLVDENGNIHDQVVPLPTDLTDQALQNLVTFLNTHLCRHQIRGSEAEFARRSQELLARYNTLLAQLTERIRGALQNPASDAVFLEGFVNFFEQPEFKDPEKMRQMISLLDQKERLLRLLAQSLDHGEEIMVNIGTESGLEVDDLSIVTAPFLGPNQSVGRIGLIGPLRMDYGRVVATLGNLSKMLSELFLGSGG